MISKYKEYSMEQLQELGSNYLISSWSYSKVSSFSRNQKAFEMQSIFGIMGKKSASSVAGNAYHEALKYYFTNRKAGKELDLVELQASAFQYIDDQKPSTWKLQKTTPDIESCRKKATTVVVALLHNFVKEIDTYMEDVAEILDVEIRHEAFLTINRVDIPLPCHGIMDLRVRLKDGRIVIMDHKSQASFTPDDEIALSSGLQSITYVTLAEDATGEKVDEVWIMENKYSENKNKAPQINAHKIEITENTRALYEALLYEPLKKMIEAVGDPDFVYLINWDDNFVDMPELCEFWARTMISEVEDFNVEESKKKLVSARLKKIRDASVQMISPAVIKKFKENAASFIQYDLSNKNMTQPEKIEHALRSFGVIVKVAHIFSGYSSETFLLEISAGQKAAGIFAHRLDLANALGTDNVRIGNSLVVYDGQSYVGVEIAKKREVDLIWTKSDLVGKKIPLGKDNFGNTIVWDFENQSTPHALVCGSTGSGKSVLIKSTIEYAFSIGVEVIIFDPKYEFERYNRRALVVSDILEIENKMIELVEDMNNRVKRGESRLTLVIFDEFADAVANARKGNKLKIYEEVVTGTNTKGQEKTERKQVGELASLEENLRILLQKGRSPGFRIMAGTQRASTKVITGDAKVNFPVRICFQVFGEVDSRVVMDEPGAESLAGKGDGLIKSPEYRGTVRFQAYYKP